MLTIKNNINTKVETLTETLGQMHYKKVGLVYPQYPGCLPPADIYGGTWEALFENDGLFFRTPGGNALAFNGGKQGDVTRRIHGGFGHHGDEHGSLLRADHGVFTGKTQSKYRSSLEPLVGAKSLSELVFDSARVVPTGPENRPVNMTYRLWRCTSI